MTEGKLLHTGKSGRLTVATKKRGIVDVLALQVDGQEIHPVWQGNEMFNTKILHFEKRITELKLGHLLDYEHMSTMEIHEPTNQIVSALGAKEAEIVSFDALNNEAWFLANFLRYRFQIGDAKAACTIEHVGCSFDLIVPYAIGLGRLIEWWRWRSEDIEKAALSQINRGKESGKGGGDSSTKRAKARHEEFISTIEQVYNESPAIRQYEGMVLEVAFDKVIPEGEYGHGQFEKYCTTIRSDEPYKTRFEKLFR
jgi:hypothetical protein